MGHFEGSNFIKLLGSLQKELRLPSSDHKAPGVAGNGGCPCPSVRPWAGARRVSIWALMCWTSEKAKLVAATQWGIINHGPYVSLDACGCHCDSAAQRSRQRCPLCLTHHLFLKGPREMGRGPALSSDPFSAQAPNSGCPARHLPDPQLESRLCHTGPVQAPVWGVPPAGPGSFLRPPSLVSWECESPGGLC